MNSVLTPTKTTLKLVSSDDAVLKKEAEIIKNPLDLKVQKLIPKMFEIMERGVKGVVGIGLAAPQIGISLRLMIIKYKDQKTTFINPKITSMSDKTVIFPEGCLSLPDTELPVIRSNKIFVKYTNELGKKCKMKAKGLLAVAIQHEIDHLDGILISDRFEEQKGLRENLGVGNEI
ncbi:MAG: peptide deformylase [Candidatus Moranbacteria bacterium]|nr:peptide deformylase [Candidatus Moranbacteria bacterium]